MARRVVLVGGGCSLVGAVVAALAFLVPSASASSERLAVSPQVEQALVSALRTSLLERGDVPTVLRIRLAVHGLSPWTSTEPMAAFDASNQTDYASACVTFSGPLPELIRLHSTYPYSPVTVAPRSLSVTCQLFARGVRGSWHVIQDTPSLGCGNVGVTLRALWDGVPVCNAPVFDL